MRWDQSDGKVLSIIGIVMLVLYGAYKGLQFLAGLTMGASFGVGLGGMSGSQHLEESRRVETDAPAQVIYRIDNDRFLTLENYIACDKGGQVYYNDSKRDIKTLLGSENDFQDFSYRLGNDVAAYRGIIINGADNGYLAFPGAVTAQYCGSGNSARGCPVFFYFSSNYGKEFIVQVIGEARRTPERFSKLKVMVANDGVYFRDESEDSENQSSYPTSHYGLYAVNKLRFFGDNLINVYDDWEREIDVLIKQELIKRKVPYANEYDSNFNVIEYARLSVPPKSSEEANRMAYELEEIFIEKRDKVYKNPIKFPELKNKSMDNKYYCNKEVKAKTITYIRENGRKETVKNEQ
ncbi:T6SS immunity protein Tli3 family protein [Chimaeribacter arupi]|uniref:T6SS immunity protein Tli3 family protein n=1 Tax=Chimaeribacter arupi TaxID=2060066 RepID=UPI000C7A1CC8|nr:hypothetical protein [Chimaeribacter arupi]PLR39003.1 hypothetical protein CYR23_02840 [Chimaeribacter arupi]